MVGPAAQRAGAAHLKAVMGISERRACSIVDADRTMVTDPAGYRVAGAATRTCQ
jgi:hypothetical protein